MLGYAEEHETTVLELTYNYGVTEYTKGNAYAQVSLLNKFSHLEVP
jgi:lactoylglutathione lyase